MRKPVATKILIHGHNGFLGSSLKSEFLNSNFEVIEIPRNFDFSDADFEVCMNPDDKPYFISAAWCSNRLPNYQNSDENEFWFRKNIQMINFCQQMNFRMLFLGTCLEYLGEEVNAYIDAKLKLRKYVLNEIMTEKYVWAKLFYVFSIEQGRPRLVADALTAKSRGLKLKLISPESSHDYIEVRDVARQISNLIQFNQAGEFDIGSGTLKTNAELVSGIENLNWYRGGDENLRSSPDSAKYEEPARNLNPFAKIRNSFTDQYFSRISQ